MSVVPLNPPAPTPPRVEDRYVEDAPPAWFSVLGLRLTRVEQEDLCAYMGGLGLTPGTKVISVQDWLHASELTRAPGGNMGWWDSEEAERKRLSLKVGDADAVLQLLTRATDEIAEIVHGAAAIAAARQSCGDPHIIRVAAGAAMQAAHQRALARLAGEPEHFFVRKFQLFAGGHWPLGHYYGAFHVF